MPTYTPAIDDASGDNFLGRELIGATTPPSYRPEICDAAYLPLEMQNEILGLWGASVSSALHRAQWTLPASPVVGMPVRIDTANSYTLLAANATDATHAKCIGFIRAIDAVDATKGYISFYHRSKGGISGASAGAKVYLKDDGSLGLSAGTVSKVLGVALSATDAELRADPVSGIVEAAISGWTTPSNSQVRNAATLTTAADCGSALAALIADLKTRGILGA